MTRMWSKKSMPRLSSSCQPSALSEILMPRLLPMLLVSSSNTESMPRLSSSCQPSALSEISMPRPLPMLLGSISNSEQITLNRCLDWAALVSQALCQKYRCRICCQHYWWVLRTVHGDELHWIDAQIEQLLSAKRTVRNIDAASAANVIGEYFKHWIDAQIEQLLSAKRTVRNVDAASAARWVPYY